MHMWQLCHLAMVVPIADAYYEADCPEKAGKEWKTERKTAKRLKRNFCFLKKKFGRLSPCKMNISRFLPLPILTIGDGRVMEYQEEDYWPLTLAYAITVHKAQGSEYPMAILPMLPCFRWMLRRNIFYTAVTRARERFIIVGSKRAIAQAIRTDYISRRNTMFGYRIRKIYEAILEQEKSA